MKHKVLSVLLALSLTVMGFSALTMAEEAPAGEPVVVSTAYGDVQGLDMGDYQAFYGIPYAAAPVGELRWQLPVDPEPWTEALDCTAPHEMSLQFVNDSEKGLIPSGSEDCLNLNVFTKAGAENLPVLVYIHGGNNQTGNPQSLNGDEIVVKDDCVYVSVSYRLGLLGFNCLPALMTEEGASGNFTLYDLAKSLDWVHENIAAFGGNPENITVSGFSAGGRDVMALLISPLFEGKFQQAIAFSGGMTTADVAMSQSQIASFLAPLAVEDGKAEDEEAAKAWLLTDGEDVKEYLYSVEAGRLACAIGDAGIRMAMFPHLYADGITLPEDGFATDNYYDVPVMMLTGSTEFSFFNNFYGYFFSPDWTSLDEDVQAAGIQFGCIYGSDMYRIFNTQMSAEAMAGKYEAPMYLCQIEFGSKDSATAIDGFGSFHGIFMPMLTHSSSYAGIYDFNADENYQAMADQYSAYLKNFLYTGDPNGEGLVEWPAWTAEEKMTQVFDAGEGGATVEAKNVYKTYAEIMDEMDADETVPEDVKMKVISNSINGRWFSSELDERYGNASLWK